jgi:hypothetical protein
METATLLRVFPFQPGLYSFSEAGPPDDPASVEASLPPAPASVFGDAPARRAGPARRRRGRTFTKEPFGEEAPG